MTLETANCSLGDSFVSVSFVLDPSGLGQAWSTMDYEAGLRWLSERPDKPFIVHDGKYANIYLLVSSEDE